MSKPMSCRTLLKKYEKHCLRNNISFRYPLSHRDVCIVLMTDTENYMIRVDRGTVYRGKRCSVPTNYTPLDFYYEVLGGD